MVESVGIAGFTAEQTIQKVYLSWNSHLIGPWSGINWFIDDINCVAA